MGDNKILRLSKPEQMYIMDVDFKHFILKSNLETQYSNANKWSTPNNVSQIIFYKRSLKQRVHAEGFYLYEIPKQTKLIYVATSQDKGYR